MNPPQRKAPPAMNHGSGPAGANGAPALPAATRGDAHAGALQQPPRAPLAPRRAPKSASLTTAVGLQQPQPLRPLPPAHRKAARHNRPGVLGSVMGPQVRACAAPALLALAGPRRAPRPGRIKCNPAAGHAGRVEAAARAVADCGGVSGPLNRCWERSGKAGDTRQASGRGARPITGRACGERHEGARAVAEGSDGTRDHGRRKAGAQERCAEGGRCCAPGLS